MPSRSFAVVALALFASVVACGDDEPVELSDPDVTVSAASPDGIPYPTDNLGATERAGTSPGKRFPNLSFRGYREGDRSRGLETISLADYYDPQMKRHKVLHIQVASTWCPICSAEIEATVGVKEAALGIGAVFLEVIIAGQVVGKGPSEDEVAAWMTRHNTNITTAIDVRARRLSPLGIDPAAQPHDILIDTRTMEILDSSAGTPPDVGVYVQTGTRWVDANPPSYPLPAVP